MIARTERVYAMPKVNHYEYTNEKQLDKSEFTRKKGQGEESCRCFLCLAEMLGYFCAVWKEA